MNSLIAAVANAAWQAVADTTTASEWDRMREHAVTVASNVWEPSLSVSDWIAKTTDALAARQQ